jgi:hypothetical protein
MTEYKDGSHRDFIEYLYGSPPKPAHTISLETPLEYDIHPALHIFQELLMIFVDGLKYFYGGDDGRVDINQLLMTDIERVKEYFVSMSYRPIVETFETIHDYKFRFPNYFKDKHKIIPECVLKDFFYEIYGKQNRVFRISFDYVSR